MSTGNLAIRVEGLGKSYQLGRKRSGDLRSSLAEGAKGLFRKSKGNQFWALRDITFEIPEGQAVGIIGKNGAGKSTLLKVLSRITYPTLGQFELFGRVSSLLEVGTGFHPELSGRENIFLNGTILGMRRAEVKSRFDEIVDFSGVEKFLDTPIKHYSSGMKVRLAFSVAAHLEPEILIVDEVLAVGDAEFQKKCLGKMENVSRNQGKTVLFVSHNIGAIETLCTKGLTLNDGNIQYYGELPDAISEYFRLIRPDHSIQEGEIELSNHPNKKYSKYYGFQRARILIDGENKNVASAGDTLSFEFDIRLEKKIENPLLGIVIKDAGSKPVLGINNRHTNTRFDTSSLELQVKFQIEHLNIYGDGLYFVDLYLGEAGEDFDVIADAFQFQIIPRDIYDSGCLPEIRLNQIIQPDAKFEQIN